MIPIARSTPSGPPANGYSPCTREVACKVSDTDQFLSVVGSIDEFRSLLSLVEAKRVELRGLRFRVDKPAQKSR